MKRARAGLATAAILMAASMLQSCGEPKPSDFAVKSSRLSHFWHRPVAVRAQILLPPSYANSPTERFPTIYWIHAFDGSYKLGRTGQRRWLGAMRASGREYIVISLDAAFHGGHDAFADSANDGPWASALVREFIPALDRRFRTLRSQRFVAGFSSGGWSALWLQLNYPGTFAGAWAIAPDPVDFHSFTGPDLTRVPPQNFYRDGRGREYGFIRQGNRDLTTLRRFITHSVWARAQYESFDAVFSPRANDGMARQLFDRRTGKIDEQVARYWEAHYDIAAILRRRWPALHQQLRGKFHLFVGTQDTYHLDAPVRLFSAELLRLHAAAQVVFVPGAGHHDVLPKGNVLDRSVAEMTPAGYASGLAENSHFK